MNPISTLPLIHYMRDDMGLYWDIWDDTFVPVYTDTQWTEDR